MPIPLHHKVVKQCRGTASGPETAGIFEITPDTRCKNMNKLKIPFMQSG